MLAWFRAFVYVVFFMGSSAWADSTTTRWDEQQIIQYMTEHPNRCYFSDLFAKGGFRVGAEVGVAGGRFSELFLLRNKDIGPWKWYMIEPFIHKDFLSRFPEGPAIGGGVGVSEKQKQHINPNLTWSRRNIGTNAEKFVIQDFSTSDKCVERLRQEKFDFIYLDGAHDYQNVKRELPLAWPLIKPGGVLAGHDYCNHGEAPLPCKGCNNIPKCRPYTPYGHAQGKKLTGISMNQKGVVTAVQEWVQQEHPELTLYHTIENYTMESLAKDGFDYDIVISHSYNPSWFFVKPKN
ncbi:class I SAM-dependent methyltransferase [archaeon]|nr:MAG: class I SAM-dependent methyltransferase [archaeon]